MAEEKQDLRIKKTERALATAMFMLLERQSFSSITVNDVCAEAMISRSAFYAHFEDKYALLKFSIITLGDKIFTKDRFTGPQDRLRTILQNVKDNAKLFKNLLMTDADDNLVQMLNRAYLKDFEELVKARNPDELPFSGPLDIINSYYTTGIMSAVMLWVKKGMPYSVDEMFECLSSLIWPGHVGALAKASSAQE